MTGKNNGWQSQLRKIAATAYKSVTLHHLYPSRYRTLSSKCQVKPNKIVFLEVREDHLSDNFALIWKELGQERKPAQGADTTKLYESKQRKLQNVEEKKQSADEQYELTLCCLQEGMAGHGQVVKNCLKAIESIADAAWIFVSDSSYFLSSLTLRPETKVIQTWHACGAFKKFGYSIADKQFGASRKELERFPVHRNFSYVTVSSPEVVDAYAEAFHMEDRKDAILPIGISRTDVFYDPKRRAEAREKLQQLVPEAEKRKLILYAPTFRGSVAGAYAPDVLDWKLLKKELGETCFFLCKHHPFVKKRPELPEDCSDFVRDMTEDMTIEELLLISDLCISDYSSLVFEYSLLEHPMLFLAYDLEEYFDWRGFYYPYQEMAPGPICRTTEEVISYVQNIEQNFDRQKVIDFRQKFMSSCDGAATERIINLIRK